MSSRDPFNRPSGDSPEPDPTEPDAEGTASRRNRFADVDPADIDRYLSGRPPRPRSTTDRGAPRSATGRPQPSRASGTARQLEQLQASVDRAARNRRDRAGNRERHPQPPAIRRTTSEPRAREEPDTWYQPAPQPEVERPVERRRASRRRIEYQDPYVDELDVDDAGDELRDWASEARTDEPAWDDEPEPATAWEPPARTRPARRTRIERPALPRPTFQKPTLPPAIAQADLVNDASALAFTGAACLSLAVMAIVVANRVGTLPPVIATHVSASGILENFADRSAVWRLPLLATMLTLMNLAAAWFISPLDRFASRFLLATSLVVQFVAWVAVIRLLW